MSDNSQVIANKYVISLATGSTLAFLVASYIP